MRAHIWDPRYQTACMQAGKGPSTVVHASRSGPLRRSVQRSYWLCGVHPKRASCSRALYFSLMDTRYYISTQSNENSYSRGRLSSHTELPHVHTYRTTGVPYAAKLERAYSRRIHLPHTIDRACVRSGLGRVAHAGCMGRTLVLRRVNMRVKPGHAHGRRDAWSAAHTHIHSTNSVARTRTTKAR